MKGFVKTIASTAIVPLFMTLTPSTHAATAMTAPSGNSVTPAEKAKIEAVVHQYLIEKPEVLIEAMQVLQTKQFDKAKQSVQKTQQDAPRFAMPLFHQTSDPVAGNPNGKITVVEFFDYQCPHCVDMAPVINAIIKANPSARIVFKEWPIRGPMSEFASRAALAANKQGKYLELHHAMLINSQQLTQDGIFQMAKTIGLDVEKLKKDMNDTNIDAQLKASMKLAQDLKLFGTPAFFIGQTNGKVNDILYVPGEMNQAQLQEAINKANP